MTGGVGYKALHHFYSNHFVNSNPLDTSLVVLMNGAFRRKAGIGCCPD